ncbi:MAG: hypothetical protein SVU88_00920 [Candidatus Nanohaloarchaea archaeon]|nr:hypothetical protein [Candidatus Nanohaloarchaea archaeon]
METGLRTASYYPLGQDEAYWNREQADRITNHDAVTEDDSRFFTIVPDLRSYRDSELENAGGPDMSRRLRELRHALAGEDPVVMGGRTVDTLLDAMYSFPAFQEWDTAEQFAVEATERTAHRYVPVGWEGGEPLSVAYSGPTDAVVFDGEWQPGQLG